MTPWMLVGAGSFLGGILRYIMGTWIQSKTLLPFPFGTFAVNLTGCLAIGLFFGLSEKYGLPLSFRLFFMTGLCGGFTTFSSFSLELLQSFHAGHYTEALLYMTGSVVLCVLATVCGIALIRML